MYQLLNFHSRGNSRVLWYHWRNIQPWQCAVDETVRWFVDSSHNFRHNKAIRTSCNSTIDYYMRRGGQWMLELLSTTQCKHKDRSNNHPWRCAVVVIVRWCRFLSKLHAVRGTIHRPVHRSTLMNYPNMSYSGHLRKRPAGACQQTSAIGATVEILAGLRFDFRRKFWLAVHFLQGLLQGLLHAQEWALRGLTSQEWDDKGVRDIQYRNFSFRWSETRTLSHKQPLDSNRVMKN